MDAIKIESEWLYLNRMAVPWRLLVGAEILTESGQRHLISAVEERPWPTGPLFTVRSIEGPTNRNGLYNVLAFNNGPFRTLVPSVQQIPLFRAVMEQLEQIRIQQERYERERQEAQRVAQERVDLLKARACNDRITQRKAIAQRKAQEAQSLNESRQFDLLIFDLDDTLLATEHLDAFRGKEYTGSQSDQYKNELAIHARTLEHLVPEALLLSLQANFPSLALSIFTRAPRGYAEILLEARFPKIKWNSIVAFEDVKHTKPHPEGILKAAKLAGVDSLNRIALVGDGKTDVLAAYQAGIQAVLLMAGWGPNWASRGNSSRSDHFKTLNFMPDAKITRANDLFIFVTRPVSLLPCLEAWDADPTFFQSPESMRVDTHNHFNNLDDAGNPNWVETHAMGRYFASSTSFGWYDFSNREAHHLVTKSILDAKYGIPYPESWAKCCANYICGYAAVLARKNLSLLVCSIPSSSESIRPLGRDRLVDFCKAVEIQLKGKCDVVFNCAILQYAPGASSNKTLDRHARFANVRDHMFVAESSDVRDMVVLVIDDVSTSGATFFYATRYLMQAGAYSVRCLALTQTIS